MSTSPAATPNDPASLRDQFAMLFPGVGRTYVIRAPGRVNLIGEHTDYNDGFVLPMAIEPEVRIVCRARSDGLVRLATTLYPDHPVEFSIDRPIERGEPSWANYPKGVAAALLDAGVPLVGMDALIANTLPPGGGLSSSAAIEVGTAQALLAVSGHEVDPMRTALLCQKAEHTYALVPCGIMDQTIVAGGKAGHAMLLDCRDLTRTFVPVDSRDVSVVIVNSMVRHELTGGEYAERRRQCEEATAYFRSKNPDVKALRDVTAAEVEAAKCDLPEIVYRRARHVVGEIARTTEAADQLSKRHYDRVGDLMRASHASLRDDYEVSTPELDSLVAESMKVRGVYGARMTGGGFGGCIVALVQPKAVEPLIDHLSRVYPVKFHVQPVCFITSAADGAGLIDV